MPHVASALVSLNDAAQALQRAQAAWNSTQLVDALRSAKAFIAAAEAAHDAARQKAGR